MRTVDTAYATADAAWDRQSIRSLFDPATGRLDRRIYEDEAIYRLELERIFARGWNFMCHESQIPNPGDYFINYIGEDQVIVVRDMSGKVNVLLNTCRHRGNALCRAEQGNAKSFICSYHGWNYGLNGDLLGVPGIKNYYRDDFDPEQGVLEVTGADFDFEILAAENWTARRLVAETYRKGRVFLAGMFEALKREHGASSEAKGAVDLSVLGQAVIDVIAQDLSDAIVTPLDIREFVAASIMAPGDFEKAAVHAPSSTMFRDVAAARKHPAG